MVERASQQTPPPDDERALWHKYVSQRDPETRALLIDRHLKTAHRIAAFLYAQRFDNSVDFSDYLQYAKVGLVEAVDRFDPARGVIFATFATYRIRGAILNGIDSATELMAQRAYRRQVVKDRMESLRSDKGRGDNLFGEMVDLTIGLALGYILEDSGLWKESDESAAADPYRVYELKRLQQRLILVVGALPERERLIVKRHYFDHKDFGVIAAELELSRGRVSQLHTRALQLMREAYRSLSRFDMSC